MYEVEIWCANGRWEAHSRYGDMKDSLPLAICRAALLVAASPASLP